MNERDIFLAALEKSDPAERTSYLARAVDDLSMTQTGVIAGTPEYMSPEQAEARPVDHRSDLFSLGSVMYTMFTSRPPFRADSTVAVIRRVCDDTPRPVREANPDIPPWLVAVIDKLLAKDPADRIQSAREVVDVLGQCLAHLQQPEAVPLPLACIPSVTDIRRSGRFVVPRRWRSTPRRRWAVAAAMLLVLFGGLGLGWTEATGITEVVPTIIRMVTGEGTLVVEVDDPNVSIQIDGKELIITGAGVHRVSVTPGRHHIQAMKDGRPVHQQLVTITRGGKQLVRISHDAAPSAARSQAASAKRRQEFDVVVRAGRHGLTDAQRTSLKEQGHMLPDLLEEPMFRRMIELLAGLPDQAHQTLLDVGYLHWPYASLDDARRREIEELFRVMLEKAKAIGFMAIEPANAAAEILGKSDVGFAVVNLRASQQQFVSFYVLAHGVPLPIAMPIVSSHPRDKPALLNVQDDQFEQLRALRNQPHSPLPDSENSAAKSTQNRSDESQSDGVPRVVRRFGPLVYRCPMHPLIKHYRAGETCPVCNMKLVRVDDPGETLTTISRDGITIENDVWRAVAHEPRVVRLFEADDVVAENCILTYRAKLKTENLDGKAYLEMWVRAPGQGEFFSKSLHQPVSGTTDWASYEVPFFLKKGERIDLVKLNLAIEGQGTVWIKEVELLRTALPVPEPSNRGEGEKPAEPEPSNAESVPHSRANGNRFDNDQHGRGRSSNFWIWRTSSGSESMG